MCFGFCVRVLVLSLLTFGQYANALSYRSGGSNAIKPLFDYPRDNKLALASDYESSAQHGGFLGSSGSSHSEGGQVDRYSPEGSVSSFGSGSLNNRKPKQNTQQPPQTNAVLQTKAGMWDLVSPQHETRFVSGIASSGVIIMNADPQPPSKPQQPGYQPPSKPQQPGYQPFGYRPKPQQPGYQPSVYSPQPQQPGYQPSVYPPQLQQPGYQPKPQPQQPGYQPFGYRPQPQQPGYQPSVYPPQPLQPGYQPSVYPPSTLPEPGYLAQPQQREIQSKPAMWELFSPIGRVSGPNLKPGYLAQPQQGVIQSKPTMWEFFSPVRGVSGLSVQPANSKVEINFAPMASPHRPRW